MQSIWSCVTEADLILLQQNDASQVSTKPTRDVHWHARTIHSMTETVASHKISANSKISAEFAPPNGFFSLLSEANQWKKIALSIVRAAFIVSHDPLWLRRPCPSIQIPLTSTTMIVNFFTNAIIDLVSKLTKQNCNNLVPTPKTVEDLLDYLLEENKTRGLEDLLEKKVVYYTI